MSQQKVVLLLGSNLGKPDENIAHAIAKIEARIGSVVARTELLRTAPVEFDSPNYFCNIALRIGTNLSPVTLLISIKKIEKEMGRATDSLISKEYEDRVIDIDIVKFGDITFSSKYLQIPHIKHLRGRDFSRQLLVELENF